MNRVCKRCVQNLYGRYWKKAVRKMIHGWKASGYNLRFRDKGMEIGSKFEDFAQLIQCRKHCRYELERMMEQDHAQ